MKTPRPVFRYTGGQALPVPPPPEVRGSPAREREWLVFSLSADGEERARWKRLRYQDRFGAAYANRIEALSRTACRAE